MSRVLQGIARTGLAAAIVGATLLFLPRLSNAELTPKRVVTADYPILLRSASMQGQVVIDCQVDKEGRVVDARVVSASTHEALQEAAIDAARQWIFDAGGSNQAAYRLSFDFLIEGECGCRDSHLSCTARSWVDLPDRVFAVGPHGCPTYR